jgi:hypothetical protein
MRGHEPIIAMRMEGTTPTIVFINDFPCDTALDWHDPGEKFREDWPADHGAELVVAVQAMGMDHAIAQSGLSA